MPRKKWWTRVIPLNEQAILGIPSLEGSVSLAEKDKITLDLIYRDTDTRKLYRATRLCLSPHIFKQLVADMQETLIDYEKRWGRKKKSRKR